MPRLYRNILFYSKFKFRCKMGKKSLFQVLVNNIEYEYSLIKIADRSVQGFLNLIPKPEHRVL